ncbi:sigma-70 family RNA polymerase sigma factor [Pendulispora rubella]|uniref:RNA polymerase sigma factor n=1 Tax=Pendulispora rubella TaxID=2741070 RepID=A0ABZ2KSG7_9BACT
MKVVRESSPSRPGPGPSDAALVVGARAGEGWAREALFGRHATRLNGLAFRLMGRDRDVDDLVQDAFVAALQSLHQLEDPNAFGSWLASILVRLARKLIRRRRMMARLGFNRDALAIDLDEIASACATPARVAEVRRLYRVIAELPADLRVPLVLHRVEGLALGEVASMTRVSLSTVKRRIEEADARLRAHHDEGNEAP